MVDMSKSHFNREDILEAARRSHAEGQRRTQLAEAQIREAMKPAYHAHFLHTAAPTIFSAFDKSGGSGGDVIRADVGTDLELFASIGTGAEAGMIVIDRAASELWILAAGAGGSCGFAIKTIEFGVTEKGAAFQPQYNATPGTGYGAKDVVVCDLTSPHFKPLHDMTAMGGSIVCRLVMRCWGPAGVTGVPWPGAFFTGVSSAVCQMKTDALQEWTPTNYGPYARVQGLLKGGVKDKPGARMILNHVLGGGNLGAIIGGIKNVVDPQRSPPR